MTGIDKLIARFLNDKMHITVEDCDKLLNNFGFELHKSGGSHRVYHKKGTSPVIIIAPKNTKYIKPGYVVKVIKRLNLEG